MRICDISHRGEKGNERQIFGKGRLSWVQQLEGYLRAWKEHLETDRQVPGWFPSWILLHCPHQRPSDHWISRRHSTAWTGIGYRVVLSRRVLGGEKLILSIRLIYGFTCRTEAESCEDGGDFNEPYNLRANTSATLITSACSITLAKWVWIWKKRQVALDRR